MGKGSEHSGNCSTLVPLEFQGHGDAAEGGRGQTVKGCVRVQRLNQVLRWGRRAQGPHWRQTAWLGLVPRVLHRETVGSWQI